MTLLELKQDIINHTLKHFYIFVGDEIGIMNIYLEKMSNTIQLSPQRVDSVQEVYTNLGSSLFGRTDSFYIVREDKDFMKSDTENLLQDLGGSYLILLCATTDSRLKFFKTYKDSTVVFEKLAPEVLKRYIFKECNLSENALNTLCDLTDCSYDVSMLECDKINQLAEYQNITVNEAFGILLKQGAIYHKEEYDVFKFTDAVLNRRFKDALHIASVLADSGVQSVTMLGALYNSIKNLLLVQVCESNDVENVTGIDSKQVYFTKKNVGKFSTKVLINAVHLIGEIVEGVKNGIIEESYAVKFVLVHLS